MAQETITYRSPGDTTDEWDIRITVEANSVRAVDDLLHAMDGGTPLVKVLDRWFSKETGMERVK